MSKLQTEILSTNDTIVIRLLLDICDKLHRGEKVDGYSAEDLPSDSFYEMMRKRFPKDVDITSGPVMYMGSIPKEKEVTLIAPVLIAPKFDGCSVALKFKRHNDTFSLIAAHSRGSDVGSKRVNSDLFDKMNKLIPTISCTAFNSACCDTEIIQNVDTISIRCEIVLKEKDDDLVSAAYVAGKINGSMEVFEEAIDKIRIVGFEIGSIITLDGEELRIPQDRVYEILSHLCYGSDQIYLKDYKVYHFKSSSEVDFDKLFKKVQSDVKQPLDGLVYCSDNWLYPKEKEGDSKYGKYAWKEQNDTIVKITGLEYSMGKTGELACVILFEPVKISGKTYQRAKVSVQKLHAFMENGLGIGAECVMMVHNNINPNIESIVTPAVKPFEALKLCPYCRSEIVRGFVKGELKHLTCVNTACPENIIQRITELLKFMNKRCKLITINAKGKQVSSKLSEAGLRKMGDLSLLRTRVPNLKEEFNKLSDTDKLMALGYSKTESGKILKRVKSIREVTVCEPLRFLLE